jgi:hypothetical protein
LKQKIGWAEPDNIIGQPRLQRVRGFHFFYIEQKHTDPSQEAPSMDLLTKKAREAYAKVIGESYAPAICNMWFKVPGESDLYDNQVGFAVREGTPQLGEAKVRYVEPTLCVSLLAWGDVSVYAKSYSPLIAFAKDKGLKCIEGFREWDLYWEGDDSKNNIIQIQHPVEVE